jgi:hypothetical protein
VPKPLHVELVAIEHPTAIVSIDKPNQEQIDAAKVKMNAANAALKIPSKVHHSRPDEYYKVKVSAPSALAYQPLMLFVIWHSY